ncbi:oxygen-independent coproporphyrinogen III oxidase [Helicobacter winghamensis]|uniref:Coproporphyrinogen-III oxidase n=1 Tax=Helicobacter winghamensis TaxID=157268 RepID=A0A2N3PKE3_9HELI|nr:oxygen-independent coproporphyrinogen III oxidase [Helicobacter winghamensis]EEO25925.1 coproporphyrinogen dehydrogenase [Helicobacter winghamensis ATCC BAA-430]PKT76942.1 oxygen-independent coproporphyrinogen III oxidase [Helicobacter winghamensis]PKT77082.1 oxygen-independent coproporphyrinogen III oxidase [Helicobacter winghamensis]PKT77644.1 oxygen-independent coproporphyrinogen III oxidase [Helicobacter winghamensis]PKT81882.1 oxygen-independent coproporphyrinogen III oxidase [Helicoba
MIDFKKFATYSKPGPRYTSYPTAIEFSENYTLDFYLQDLRSDTNPLSLYVHLPFCRSACYFCGCNVIYTSKEENKILYLEYLKKELALLENAMDTQKPIYQLHFGGGTPTFFSASELEFLIALLKKTFPNFSDDAEIACEIDPRFFSLEQMRALKNGGFNRLSFGIQDFDENVQRAIHRIQPFSLVQDSINIARNFGVTSINFDLIYGLPFQTLDTFKNTLELALKLNPDRFAIFNYAHVPWIKKTMRKIDETTLPAPEEKLKILEFSIQFLQEKGYKMIGMDHFAKPDDELFKSISKGQLRRNFQGYSTKGGTQTVGIGLTSIGEGSDYYAQNFKTMLEYQNALDNGILPFQKGVKLNADDKLRKTVIMQLMSNFRLNFHAIESQFKINFTSYFADALEALKPLENAGLIALNKDEIQVSQTGMLLIRNIAMPFDAYLKHINTSQKVFSKTI